MNKVQLIGRLVREPELRVTETGVPFVNYTLAVERRMSKDKGADFINIVSWGSQGEFVTNYFTKGLRVGIVGRIQSSTWTDKEGVKKYAVNVATEELFFADGKGADTPSGKDFETIDTTQDSDLPF